MCRYIYIWNNVIFNKDSFNKNIIFPKNEKETNLLAFGDWSISKEGNQSLAILENLINKNVDNLRILCVPLLFRLACLKSNNPQPLPVIKKQYHDVHIDIDIDKQA